MLVLLGLTEVTLRLIDYRGPADDPYESFVLHRPLFEADGDEMRTSPARRELFNDQRFARVKPPGTVRIAAFGGSATHGYHLPDPARDSYLSLTARLLAAVSPGREVETINCGGISYASYRLVGLVREVLAYDPDAVIVMTGHNEFLEPRHYGELLGAEKPPFWTYRLRLGRLLRNLTAQVESRPAAPTGTDVVFGDEITEQYVVRTEDERRRTLEHFARNLDRMIDACRDRDVPVVLVTLPSNIRDFTPLHTEPRGGLTMEDLSKRLEEIKALVAEERYSEALLETRRELEIDGNAAIYHYLAGLCLDKLDRPLEATEQYVLARDTDAFPHRCPTAFNEKIREIARKREVLLVDADEAFRRASPWGAPGNNLFVDQCHPNLEGHRIIAAGLAEVLDPILFGGGR